MSKKEINSLKRWWKFLMAVLHPIAGVFLWIVLLVKMYPLALAVAAVVGLAVYSELHEEDPFELTQIYID